MKDDAQAPPYVEPKKHSGAIFGLWLFKLVLLLPAYLGLMVLFAFYTNHRILSIMLAALVAIAYQGLTVYVSMNKRNYTALLENNIEVVNSHGRLIASTLWSVIVSLLLFTPALLIFLKL